ncbi:MAG: hypothetical protein HZA17_06370 [Nitrospirae bacterium]|nr:hypothetical protein [Nitrospirota bacterium]
MDTREYFELFRYLMEQYCLRQEDVLFVENIAAWCREQGLPEPDKERPMRLVLKTPVGCRLLIREYIPDKIIGQRMNALRIRSQLKSVATDMADRLNSGRKELAYLFLSEYAATLPEIGDDELLADDWAFKEMERLGFFRS